MMDGVGIDVIAIDRIKQSLGRTLGLAPSLFTEAECINLLQSLAARFAVKQVSIKALDAHNGILWHEAKVVNLERGKPEFIFHGAFADLVDGANVQLSISHRAGIAAAIVEHQ